MRWLALIAPIVFAAAICGGSNAQQAPAAGTIAFVRGNQLWIMGADGSKPRRLTRTRGWKASPVWSPDGRRIAYESPGRNRDGSSLYVVNVDGGGPLRVTRTHKDDYEYEDHHDWSPDGRTIVFERNDSDPNYAVWLVGLDGTGERLLTPQWGWPRGAFADPDWSPNGRMISFTHVHKGAVYVIRPDRSGRRAIASMKWSERTWGAKWSPDGRLIAFVSDDYLWVMNADGTQPRKLLDGRVDNRGRRSSDFAWSPDSRQIAFTQCCREPEIYLVNADGSGLRQLTDSVSYNANPTWSRDGRAIAFVSGRDGNAEIYLMNADGSDQRNVSRSPLADHSPAWSPKS